MEEPKTLNLELLQIAMLENNKKIIKYLSQSNAEMELLRQQNALLTEEINQLSEILDTINRAVVT